MKLILSIVIVGIIFLAGCTVQQTDNITQNESSEENETKNETIELPKENVTEKPEFNITINLTGLRYCEQDSECTKVTDGCCGCRMGGKDTAINKNYTDYWINNIVIEQCKTQACVQAISHHITCYAHSICVNNTCILDYKNFTVCEEQHVFDRGRCYYQFAIQGNNITLCEKTEVEEDKIACKNKLS